MLKTRPYIAGTKIERTLALPCPVFELDENKSDQVKCYSDGSPIFQLGKSDRIESDLYMVMVRKAFLKHFCNSKGLKLTQQNVFWHMLSRCSYSRVIYYYDPITKYPVIADKAGTKALTQLAPSGNITTSFTYQEMMQDVGVTQRSVRDALHCLIALNIVREVDVPKQSRTNHAKKGGRPEDLMRYEINSEHAWNGPLQHGLSHPCIPLQTIQTSNRENQTDPEPETEIGNDE